jgi:hypothetical protein
MYIIMGCIQKDKGSTAAIVHRLHPEPLLLPRSPGDGSCSGIQAQQWMHHMRAALLHPSASKHANFCFELI